MTDDLVKRWDEYAESNGVLAQLWMGKIIGQQMRDRIEALTAERDRLREAIAIIDAIDPEHHIDGCALTVVRGLVLRMGETARAALKGESHE